MEVTRLIQIVIPLKEVRDAVKSMLPISLDNKKIQLMLFDLASVTLASESAVFFYDSGCYYDILTDGGMDDSEINNFMDDMYSVFYGLVNPYLQEFDIYNNTEIDYYFDMCGLDTMLFCIEPSQLELRDCEPAP